MEQDEPPNPQQSQRIRGICQGAFGVRTTLIQRLIRCPDVLGARADRVILRPDY
jgi:hypothetical protein